MSDFKQAVIDILTRYRNSWQGDYYVPFRKAIDEISALSEKMQLSQEDTTKDTTSDLISRLDVLQLIRTLPPEEGMTKGLLEMSVKQLPSADASLMQDRCKIDASAERKGHWIDTNTSTTMYIPRYKCSVCNGRANKSNFCPNCGADMRGKQNDTRDE